MLSDRPILLVRFGFRTTLVRCSTSFYFHPYVPAGTGGKLRCVLLYIVKLSCVYHFFEFFIIAAMSRRLCSSVCANCIALVLPSLWNAETEKMKPFFRTL